MVRLDFAISAARVLSQEKKYTESTNRLNTAVRDASKMGLMQYELDARLALGENQIASGQKQQGIATARKVQIDAGHQGFVLMARNRLR